jgi:flotillin
METETIYVIAAIAIAVIAFFLLISYVKAPPSYAFIITGLSKEPRVLIGTCGFRIPFFERIDHIYLDQISIDIKTEECMLTRDAAKVKVEALAKIQIMQDHESIRLASRSFLNMTPDKIADHVQDVMQSNMLGLIRETDLDSLNNDRRIFADRMIKMTAPVMAKLGMDLFYFNLQKVTEK